MKRIASVIATALLLFVFPAPATLEAAEPVDSSERHTELYSLLPVAEGRWQVYVVPRPWLKTHWQGPEITALYFALSSPSPKAIADDVGPCVGPARLVAVVTREGHATTEVPLEYYDFCSPHIAQTHADWPSGPQVYVEGIAVRLGADGHVEIEQSFRRRSAEPYPVDRNPATFARPATGAAVSRTRILSLEEIYRGLK